VAHRFLLPVRLEQAERFRRAGALIDPDCSSLRAGSGPESIRRNEEIGISPADVNFKWNRITRNVLAKYDEGKLVMECMIETKALRR